jgi:dihydroxyacetone kinase
VLVYKIAGALAHRGADIDQIYSTASWIAENVATVGVGLEHTHVTNIISYYYLQTLNAST